jgi:1-acyl-sn-glycerol-3-phosphate acyltransferase
MSDWLTARMALPPLGGAGWFRVVWRGGFLAVVTYGGLALLLALRLVERPMSGAVRPVTPWITVGVCRVAVRLLGLRVRVRGIPAHVRGALVANHAGWLDIFTLNAVQPIYFVSKSEVASWAGIGVLARAVGTVFIARKASEAAEQARMLAGRLAAGHRLLFFPEGTSSDARRVLPFKPALFAAFFADALREIIEVQPVTVIYRAPFGMDARFYGWWGDMEFAPHLLAVLAHPGGSVEVVFHDPVRVADFADRKALAAYCHGVIAAGFEVGV